jgi:peptide/nickel transport system substrate-binding protein
VSTPRNPFRDVRVRRAVALAIDRDALVRGPLAGQAEVVDQIVSPQVFGHHDGLPLLAHDPAEARRLLAEAGYADGFEVDLDLTATAGRPHPALEPVMRDLGAVGIRVRPRASQLASLLDRVERRDTALYLMGWISTSGDAGSSAEYLLHTPGGAYGIDNGGGYSSPDVDRLLGEAARCLDSGERRLLLRRAFERVHEDVPVVPLYRATDIYAVAERLVFVPRLDREIRGAELRWSAGR